VSEELAIFRVRRALSLRASGRALGLDALTVNAGESVALVPPKGVLGADLATTVARVLVTIRPPDAGSVELLGHEPGTLSYLELSRLRTRLGFVQGHGGLLSNRSLRDNVALPLAVHLRRDEEETVSELLVRFDLTRVAELRPHQVDGATRFRACAARALVLSPRWLVVEGVGDFDAEAGPSLTWQRLFAYQVKAQAALAVCLARPMPGFEAWFSAQGGRLLRYRLLTEAPPAPNGESA
jgi:ABC-type methionine transport system ATPase subunit